MGFLKSTIILIGAVVLGALVGGFGIAFIAGLFPTRGASEPAIESTAHVVSGFFCGSVVGASVGFLFGLFGIMRR
jgi:hypothetical protein